MRIPKYLSYSNLSQYEKEIDEWVLRYGTDDRPDREAQGKAAAVGSAFDAVVKSFLYERIHGPGYKPELYSYEALFERQVEAHNRDYAGPEGQYIFGCYRVSGFLDRITKLVDQAIQPPEFEFSIERVVGGVPLLGKPDGYIVLPCLKVVLDFKVNGYCSKASTSPNAGYLLCSDGYVADKQSKSHNTTHKNVTPRDFNGVTLSGYLEDASEAWASQLTGYAWCLGEEVGDENTVMTIHQCVAKQIPDARPLLRFAEFAGPVRKPFQEFLLQRYQKLWNAIQTNHIYPHLSVEESRQRFDMMNRQATSMVNATGDDKVFNDLIRPTFRG